MDWKCDWFLLGAQVSDFIPDDYLNIGDFRFWSLHWFCPLYFLNERLIVGSNCDMNLNTKFEQTCSRNCSISLPHNQICAKRRWCWPEIRHCILVDTQKYANQSLWNEITVSCDLSGIPLLMPLKVGFLCVCIIQLYNSMVVKFHSRALLLSFSPSWREWLCKMQCG